MGELIEKGGEGERMVKEKGVVEICEEGEVVKMIVEVVDGKEE